MEKTITLLVIGRHQSIMDKVKALLEQHNYLVYGVLTDEEAFEIFNSKSIDAVVIGGGIESDSRNKFHQEFLNINPKVKIIDANPQTILGDLQKAFS